MSEGGNTTQAFWAVLGVLALGGAVLYGRERKRQKRHALESGQRLQADAHARRAIDRANERLAAFEHNLADTGHGNAKVRQKLLLALTVEIGALIAAADDADDRWSKETAGRARETHTRFEVLREKALRLDAQTRNRKLGKGMPDEAIEAELVRLVERDNFARLQEVARNLDLPLARVRKLAYALEDRRGWRTQRVGGEEVLAIKRTA